MAEDVASTQDLLRILAAELTGDRDICRIVDVPNEVEEDSERPGHERGYLVEKRIRFENRRFARNPVCFQGTIPADLGRRLRGYADRRGRALPLFLKAPRVLTEPREC
jgi:hypothetical protein